MSEISGLQGVLTDLFGQYTNGVIPYEEYAANVQMIQQKDPEMFQEAQKTKRDPAPGGWDSAKLGNPGSSVAAVGAPPSPWEDFSGLFK
jgi:hypothetical protein